MHLGIPALLDFYSIHASEESLVLLLLIQFIRNLIKINRPRLNLSLNYRQFKSIPACRAKDTVPLWPLQPIV